MKFKASDFDIISPNALEIINDADNIKEICEMSNVHVDFKKVKKAIEVTINFANNHETSFSSIEEFALNYMNSMAESLLNETNMEHYCIKLAAINEMAKYTGKRI